MTVPSRQARRAVLPAWCHSRIVAALLGSGSVSGMAILWPWPFEFTAHVLMIAYVHLAALL